MSNLSISTSLEHTKIATKALQQKTQKGIGSGVSATIGAPTVIKWETKLTMPKTVETYYVGKSLATEIYPMLKDMEPPIREKNTITGMTLSIFSLKRNR